ncbi:hypothetical protein Ahy_B06g080426 [Arachis hypogaea]|uniref:Aminotransferase-like plant mobile domain-containing protein n=1 Tax=Arachis hypogaea TaxID=3818 RepID=A0A444YI10_ARAHY|nr:hypothetical protein Ahy_B06g080426 [Arachis hypogaea]
MVSFLASRPRLLLPKQYSETHTFHLPWDESTITLQDIACHLRLHTDEKPVSGCLHDFQTWYHRPTWEHVEKLLGARPPLPAQQGVQRKESFSIKLT